MFPRCGSRFESRGSLQLFSAKRPAEQTARHWRSHGNLLFANWLNYYVYQITPYDLRHMNPTLE
ncbi:homoserine O-succinyltransferase [Klebsiella variicola subsp. variicola]|nr:homoserine O-succinyltransferase [Klebsiella variicola subsp. variicola]